MSDAVIIIRKGHQSNVPGRGTRDVMIAVTGAEEAKRDDNDL